MTRRLASGRAFALELDVFRGLAALLMVVNHAGFALLSPADALHSLSGSAVFVGSFAPVIFFFATGFGIALATASVARRFDVIGLLWKALLLVVADQLFFWRDGIAWGIDFFSFIALGTVVVTLVSRSRRAVPICVGLIVLLLGLRYGLGPALRSRLVGGGLLDWIIGVVGTPDVSYPLSPWMVYPLLGFVLGRLYAGVDLGSSQSRNLWFTRGAVALVVLFGASLALLIADTGFFRWGTVSAAFFVLSLGSLVATGLLAMYLTLAHHRIADLLALRGVASFAVIPVHYALLDLCLAALPVPVGQPAFAALVVSIAAVSFVTASAFATLVSGEFFEVHRRTLLIVFSIVLVALASVLLLGAPREHASGAVLAIGGQLVVAVLLGIRLTRPAPPRLNPA